MAEIKGKTAVVTFNTSTTHYHAAAEKVSQSEQHLGNEDSF